MYGDDSTNMASDKSIDSLESKLTDNFKQVAKWMVKNKLTLHIGKTKVQLIGSYKKVNKDTKITIVYNGSTLDQVYTTKLLGIHIDSNLTWHDHFDYICKKMSQKIGVIKRLRGILDDNILKLVFNTIVLPHMDFACTVWGRCSNVVNIDRITKLQKRAARVILKCGIQDMDSKALFSSIKWMPFQDRVSYRRCIMMFKIVNNIAPNYLQTFKPISLVHSHNTRSAARGNLYHEKACLKYKTRTFQFEASRLWNNLSTAMRQAKTIDSFKSQYLSWYFK